MHVGRALCARTCNTLPRCRPLLGELSCELRPKRPGLRDLAKTIRDSLMMDAGEDTQKWTWGPWLRLWSRGLFFLNFFFLELEHDK